MPRERLPDRRGHEVISSEHDGQRYVAGIGRFADDNPMQSPIHLALKCHARTRSGRLCQTPAMPNGRCRMHGGKSPGAPKGNKNAFKHGHYSAEANLRRRRITALLRSMKALARDTI
jgi:hypothetical protein